MISDAEYKIMEVLWGKSPLTAKQIIELISSQSDWQEKTVKTLLNRLLKKQAISFQKQGREYLYSPLIEKQFYQSEASSNFLQQMFDGKFSNFVSAFSRQENISKEDLEELENLIKELKQ